VFELVYSNRRLPSRRKPGNTCFSISLPESKRAYSIGFVRKNSETLGFIVKRVEGGKGKFPPLCDLPNSVPNLPPWARWGISPSAKPTHPSALSALVRVSPPSTFNSNGMQNWDFLRPVKLVFGVRTSADLFYAEEIERLANQLPNFSYEPYASRENSQKAKSGRVTDAITKNSLTGTKNSISAVRLPW
jgi:hypothetical protein